MFRNESWFPVRLPALCLVLLTAAGTASAMESTRVVIEGGVLRPLAELGAAYEPVNFGLGAGDGYEVGFGLRYPVAKAWVISPAFHFVDFERHVLTDAAENEFRTEALSYRTTAELMWSPEGREGGLRALLAVGGGLYRNRVVGYYDDPAIEERNDTVNTFGWYLRWGFRSDSFEVSFLWNRNTVRTWRYFEADERGKYGWHSLGVRLGYLLPW